MDKIAAVEDRHTREILERRVDQIEVFKGDFVPKSEFVKGDIGGVADLLIAGDAIGKAFRPGFW